MDRLRTKSIVAIGLLMLITVYAVAIFSDVKKLFPEASPPAISLSLSTSTAVVRPLKLADDLVVQPQKIIQGDPIMVTVEGLSTSTVKKIMFNGVPVEIVSYRSIPTAFIAVDLHQKPGVYPLTVAFSDGRIITKNITVLARAKIEAPLGIPEKLGGNTTAAATNVVDSLAAENEILAGLTSADRTLWSRAFLSPVADPVVTDIYGYTRQTGPYEIPHKGVDFKAASGTPVMAINDGRVLIAAPFGLYGNTIVVDHGAGIMSFYMHLSEIDVKKGDTVARGELIGASGETGYAEGPHLHLTVRIGGISIDPIVFLGFF